MKEIIKETIIISFGVGITLYSFWFVSVQIMKYESEKRHKLQNISQEHIRQLDSMRIAGN